MDSSLKIVCDHFFTISVFFFRFFFLRKSQNILIFFSTFFYFTHPMKMITGRRHWVLTEESPMLTTMDDNNYVDRVCTGVSSPCQIFLTVYHPGLISLSEIMTPVLEFFLACIERDSLCYNIFVSSQ